MSVLYRLSVEQYHDMIRKGILKDGDPVDLGTGLFVLQKTDLALPDTLSIGLIANPASGKDIRRLVAHASVFDNAEKRNIVRRVILGAAAAGAQDVVYMPDSHNLVASAVAGSPMANRRRRSILGRPSACPAKAVASRKAPGSQRSTL